MPLSESDVLKFEEDSESRASGDSGLSSELRLTTRVSAIRLAPARGATSLQDLSPMPPALLLLCSYTAPTLLGL